MRNVKDFGLMKGSMAEYRDGSWVRAHAMFVGGAGVELQVKVQIWR